MAFLLRQISYSAEGREIVRSSRVKDDLLRIGRDPDCDIRLNDLAVALKHCVIEVINERQIGVSAESGLTVELNGRSTNFGKIDLAGGGDIKIASHLLRIMPTAPGSADIAIDVQKITDADIRLDKSAEREFSLVSVLPSKRISAYALTLAVFAMFLAWPVWTYVERVNRPTQPSAPLMLASGQNFHPDSTWSSGRLSLSHQGLEKNCQACHVKAFEAVRDESCASCHATSHDHADPFRIARAQPDLTQWGRVELAIKETFNIPADRCVDCHSEHEGRTQMASTAQRFCSDCHAKLDEKLPDTKLANAGDFETSHPQFQPAVLTRWNGNRPVLQRVSFDANPRENSNLKFPHDMHLSTSNGVAQMARRLGGEFGFGQALACKDCHVADPTGTRFQPVDMEGDCQMCHSLGIETIGGTTRQLSHGKPELVVADIRSFYQSRGAYRPAGLPVASYARQRPGEVNFIRRAQDVARGQAAVPMQTDAMVRTTFSGNGVCGECHVASFVGGKPKIAPVAFPVRYMHKGWFDHRPHQTVELRSGAVVTGQQACVACHDATRSGTSSDLLLPPLQTKASSTVMGCRDCHGGETTSKAVPSGCAMCHDFHMDGGAPSQLIRQRVRGKKQDNQVIARAHSAVRPIALAQVRAAEGKR
ncbi:MAG TPA: cytochrome c3 family protein [Allosphingosinicella sp.]|jgi:hypothetical protein